MSLILVVEETEKDSNEYTGVLTRYYIYGTDRKDEKKFGWKMGILNDGRKYFSIYLDRVLETNIKRDMNTDTYNQEVSSLFPGLVVKDVTVDEGCQGDVSDIIEDDGNLLLGRKKEYEDTQGTQTLSSSGSETTLDGMTTSINHSF